MKKFIFVIICLCLSVSIQAQTIHWLTFVDTNDSSIGEMDKNGQSLLFSRFRNVVNAALATYGYTADNQEFFGNRLTPQNCKEAVSSLKCSEDDIVIFYYIGHGTHAAKEKNKFPQMLMGKGWQDERMFIPLQWVHNQLCSKGARLSLTIGMCCNPIQIASAKDNLTFSSSSFKYNYGSSYLSDAEIDRILTLFLESKGNLIQASASVGELSWGYGFPDMGKPGIDTFTRFLILQFEDLIKTGGTLTWDSFLSAIGNKVSQWQRTVVSQDPKMSADAQREGYSPYQTPFNEINIVRCSRPVLPIITPQPGTNLEELVGKYLTFISNANNPLDKRIEIGRQMKKLFAPSARVKILGQDGNVVVNSRPFDDYISIVSKSRIIINVTYIDLNVDSNGLVTELIVKEFYRK